LQREDSKLCSVLCAISYVIGLISKQDAYNLKQRRGESFGQDQKIEK
jgi:hypothetical protein